MKLGRKGMSVAILALLSWLGIHPALASIYQVPSVRVRVPAVSQNQDPRTIGLARARRDAFQTLLRRMLTRTDRAVHRQVLDKLGRQDQQLVERAVVRGEKRLEEGLLLTVDITFSQKAVSDALTQLGVTYSETPYPPILAVVRQGQGIAGRSRPTNPFFRTFHQTAHTFGLTIITPLGDMEDMGNLSWQRAAAGDRELVRWATSRYGIGSVWALEAGFGTKAPRSEEGKSSFSAIRLLISRIGAGVTHYRVPGGKRPECDALGTGGRARACYYAHLSETVLQQVLDQWIREHAVDPSLRHATRLRVIHDMHFPRYERFLSGLRTIPGLSAIRFLQFQAREAMLEVDYQGRDDQLIRAISRLNVHMEEGDGEIRLRLP